MSTESLLQSRNYEDSLHNRKVQGRSSLDTFIIPNRTRFPSSKPKILEDFDLPLTQTLLSIEAMAPPDAPGLRTSSQRAVLPVSEGHLVQDASRVHEMSLIRQPGSNGTCSGLSARYDGPIDSIDRSTGTSITWSNVSARNFTDSTTASDHRDTSDFVKKYNTLATQHGLPLFSMQPDVESRSKHRFIYLYVNTDLHPQYRAWRAPRAPRAASLWQANRTGFFARSCARVLLLIVSEARPRV